MRTIIFLSVLLMSASAFSQESMLQCKFTDANKNKMPVILIGERDENGTFELVGQHKELGIEFTGSRVSGVVLKVQFSEVQNAVISQSKYKKIIYKSGFGRGNWYWDGMAVFDLECDPKKIKALN